jgi:hypothetical protein
MTMSVIALDEGVERLCLVSTHCVFASMHQQSAIDAPRTESY